MNGIAEESASRELPPIAALEGIRKRQALERVTAEVHNRNHQAWLRKGAPSFETLCRLEGERGSDTPLPTAFNPWATQTKPESNFDFSSQDPGREAGAYGTWPEGAPRLRAGERVTDAEGRLRGGEGDHWSDGKVKPVNDAESWMLEAARLLIETARQRRYPEGRV